MMRTGRRFYFLLAGFLLSLSMWVALRDDLLLSIWLGIFMLVLISYLIAKTALVGIELERHSRIKSREIGGVFEERMEIRNSSGFPKIWLEIIDQSALMGNINSRVVTGLGKNRSAFYTSTVILNLRGVYPLGPTEIVSGDPFGIFQTSRIIENPNHLLVYPKITVLRRFMGLPSEQTGGENLRTQTVHTTPQAAGVREHFPGDPLNRVHWPSTAKRNRLMVKEFEEDTRASVWIFLDSNFENYAHASDPPPAAIDRNLRPLGKPARYQLPKDCYEYAVCICASIADYFLRRDRFVGFASAGRQPHLITADKGQRQLMKILEELAVILPEGKLLLNQLLVKQIRNIPRGSSIILVTPRIDERLEILMEIIQRKGYRCLAVTLDGESFKEGETREKSDRGEKTPNRIHIAYGDDLEEALSAA